jgi:hypothetical protein
VPSDRAGVLAMALRGRFGVTAVLPIFRPFARAERGWASAFPARTCRILRVSDLFRPGLQCRKNSAGFLPEFCTFAREERGWASAFRGRGLSIAWCKSGLLCLI